ASRGLLPLRGGAGPCSTLRSLIPGRTRNPEPTVLDASGLAWGQSPVVQSWQGSQHRHPREVLAEGDYALREDQVLRDEGVPRHVPHQDLQGLLGQVASLPAVGPATIVE